jgi:hypothetical protein
MHLHLPAYFHDGGDGPKGVGNAAGSGGFLTENVQPRRNAFVDGSAGGATGTNGAKNYISPGQSVLKVFGQPKPGRLGTVGQGKVT